MKTLVLIRHAKATHEIMPDKNRFITQKGINRTQKNAELLQKEGISPDLIISSPAKRAIQTAEIIANTFSYSIERIEINNHFYFEPRPLVIRDILSLSDDVKTVFLIGHNNLWTNLSNEFSSQDIWHLRTSGIFGVQFHTKKWKNIFTNLKIDLILIN